MISNYKVSPSKASLLDQQRRTKYRNKTFTEQKILISDLLNPEELIGHCNKLLTLGQLDLAWTVHCYLAFTGPDITVGKDKIRETILSHLVS